MIPNTIRLVESDDAMLARSGVRRLGFFARLGPARRVELLKLGAVDVLADCALRSRPGRTPERAASEEEKTRVAVFAVLAELAVDADGRAAISGRMDVLNAAKDCDDPAARALVEAMNLPVPATATAT